MKCPICLSKIDFAKASAHCEKGHAFTTRNGVYQIVEPTYAQRLHTFLAGFEDFRKDEVAKYAPEILPLLPNCTFDHGLWSLRQIDLKLVRKYTKDNGNALEVGAWNSWLTHHIVKSGMETTAIDIFSHEIDGLGAQKHYAENWRAIQMDLQRLELLDDTFDLIIVNRCLPYFTDAIHTIEVLKSLLSKNGKLLITGITYETNHSRIEQQLGAATTAFEKKYKTPFKLHEYKGFVTKKELQRLQSNKMKLKYYPELRLRSLLGKVIASRPVYYYGIFEK